MTGSMQGQREPAKGRSSREAISLTHAAHSAIANSRGTPASTSNSWVGG
jgi:hypothetical protein